MKKLNFKFINQKLQLVLRRMPLSLLMVAGFAACSFLSIHKETEFPSSKFFIFFGIGALLSAVSTLWLEDKVKTFWKQYLFSFLVIAIWGIYCFLLPEKIYTDSIIQIAVTGFCSVVAIFFISFLGRDIDAELSKDNAFWEFSKRIIFNFLLAAVFALVLFSGLTFATMGIQSLFGATFDLDRMISYLAVMCYSVFVPIFLLTNIPYGIDKHNPDLKFYKVFKVLGMYILLPLLSLYALILYTYLIKIVVVWELPDGWVSRLVSSFAAGGLIVSIILYPLYNERKNKIITFFYRNVGLIILPLLVLMTIGVIRRISDYGITINRLYILVLNIWFYGIYFYLWITKTKHIKWIAISPVLLALLVSVGPWKISSITKNNLSKQVYGILDGKQITEDFAVINSLDSNKRMKLQDNLKYLSENYGNESTQKFFKEGMEDAEISRIISKPYNTGCFFGELKRYFSSYGDILTKFNIQEYSSAIIINYNDRITDSKNASEIKNDTIIKNDTLSIGSLRISLKDIAKSLKDKDKKQIPIIKKEQNYALVITEIAGYCTEQDTNIKITDLSGCLYLK
ncbi:MAG: DUF4153 domain-containing protein [Bacteroidales bacterium]|jgi:hypothetical protein|nr:DUF4153 domain-containing protein [Bacteroidales bacterium]